MIRRWNSLLHKKKGQRTNLPDYLPNPLTRCMISSSSVIFHLQSLIFQHSGSSTNLHIKDSVTAQLRHSSSYWTITSYLWSLIFPLPNPLNKALCCLLLCANRRPDLNMLHNAEPSSTQNPDPFAKLVQAIQQFLQPPSTTLHNLPPPVPWPVLQCTLVRNVVDSYSNARSSLRCSSKYSPVIGPRSPI